ncbi:uracil-DNA glycosylase [Aquicoccus sp. SCR17]|nr:uracil-DNA glycosylase [Carideicomes alvinocaridis]
MESGMDYWAAKAALDWLVELGADEAIGEVPVDRFALEASQPKPAAQPAAGQPGSAAAPAQQPQEADPVEVATRMAGQAATLEALRAALGGFEHCELKQGARNLVFADGTEAGRVMIIGEAPGRDEDREGLPFVGRAGQLLDRMLAAIDLGRTHPDAERGVYITNILPWRPPQNRDPTAEEIGMMLPFMRRHIELVDPEAIVLMGNISCQAMLGRRGITRLRGTWTEVAGRPALPMFHPAYLLRNPHAKREAWADLLALRARLEGLE